MDVRLRRKTEGEIATRKELERSYPPGTRVRLVTESKNLPPAGTIGTVQWVEGRDRIYVRWDDEGPYKRTLIYEGDAERLGNNVADAADS
jgi:hypothetical protein